MHESETKQYASSAVCRHEKRARSTCASTQPVGIGAPAPNDLTLIFDWCMYPSILFSIYYDDLIHSKLLETP